jgi:AcrR family transcriptional regulator
MTANASPSEATDTRSRILEEAEKLFAERDFSGTGMMEIAKRVGITKSVIYHHFRNKDDILKTLIDDFIGQAVELNRQLPEKYGLDTSHPLATETEVTENLMREMIDFLGSRRWMLRIILLQSVKEAGEVPLFEVAARFAQDAGDCCGVPEEIVREKMTEIRVADFFMNFLPVIVFLVFQERWCERVGIDRNTAMDRYVDLYVRYTKRVYWPIFGKEEP